MSESSARSLTTRVLRAGRTLEPEVREAIRAVRSVAEAHERLIARGIISERWMSELGAFYAGSRCGCVRSQGWVNPAPEGCPKCFGSCRAPLALPRRLSQLVLLASQPEHALAAVALARDFRARAAQWGHSVGPAVGWLEFDPFCLSLSGPTFVAPTRVGFGFSFVTNAKELAPALEAVIGRYREDRKISIHEQFGVLNLLRCDLSSRALYRDACARGLSVRALVDERRLQMAPKRVAAMTPDPMVLDRTVDSLPDLTEPLIELWALGFAPVLANQNGFVIGTVPERMRVWRRRGLDPRG